MYALLGSKPALYISEEVSFVSGKELSSNKPRDEKDLYLLYKKEGGCDSKDDFKLKWDSGEIEIGNVRELREFKQKLASLID